MYKNKFCNWKRRRDSRYASSVSFSSSNLRARALHGSPAAIRTSTTFAKYAISSRQPPQLIFYLYWHGLLQMSPIFLTKTTRLHILSLIYELHVSFPRHTLCGSVLMDERIRPFIQNSNSYFFRSTLFLN